METPYDYLARTESAVRHLFHGVNEYMQILKPTQGAVFIGSYTNEEEHRQALEQWNIENDEEIQRSLAAQHDFLAEKHALATLCGAVLQVAAMAIRLFSSNKEVSPAFSSVLKPNTIPAKFCIGREIRGVPLGLVIYAGRNQYNHAEDGKLKEPNHFIFEQLTNAYGDGIRDPAFDLNNDLIWIYSSNIMSIIGWRDYAAYTRDMQNLLNI
jgi:hypothetical protein